MTPDLQNPLTETHFQQLLDAQRMIEQLESLLQRAKIAGIDVASREAEVREAKARILKLKQAFFPGR